MDRNELRAFRESEGLTQRALAARLGLRHKDTVRAWENGKTPISGPAALTMRMVSRLRQAGDDTARAVLEGLWTGP